MVVNGTKKNKSINPIIFDAVSPINSCRKPTIIPIPAITKSLHKTPPKNPLTNSLLLERALDPLIPSSISTYSEKANQTVKIIPGMMNKSEPPNTHNPTKKPIQMKDRSTLQPFFKDFLIPIFCSLSFIR